MKRIWFSVSLITIIIGISIFSFAYTRKTNKEILGYVDELSKSSEDEDFEDVEPIIDTMEERWEKQEKIYATFIHHDVIEEISISMTNIKAFASDRSVPEFTAECDKIKSLLKHIENQQRISIINIF